jgi:glycosyltransferase involved in cell wall biosynthesis
VKVLFVCSGNKAGHPKDVVNNQGNALKKQGTDLDFFCTREGGLWGYLKALPALHRRLKKNPPDIVHAHYSLSGFLAYFAGARPLIVSLMGSEMYHCRPIRILIRLFAKYFWICTIVKTAGMKEKLRVKDAIVVPNGIDLTVFSECDRKEALIKTSLDGSKINILFVADPDRPEKNYKLARNAVDMLKEENVVLTPLYNVPNTDLPWYYCAADVVLLSSLWEGSPNVIKEAMACGCPIVSTDVGDVRLITGSVEGTYLASQYTSDMAHKLREAIIFSQTTGRTKGRERIKVLELDSESISKEILTIYEEVLKKIHNKRLIRE